MTREEAIVKIKAWDFLDNDEKEVLETLIPELQQSEDEKIQEDLIQWINEFPDTIWRGHYKKDIIAWLEKQCKDSYFLTPEESLGISSEKYSEIVDECIFGDQKQVDGFDAELNALLKKYEHLPKEELAECLSFYLGVVQGERKPAWSEEDKHRLEDTIYFLDTAKKHYASTVELDACINWLKSLKLQKQWKPTEEQIHWLKWAINRLPDTEKANEAEAVLEDLLEVLKERTGGQQ